MASKFKLAIFLLGLSGHIYACKCAGPRTIKESVTSADGVIYGEVIRKELVSFGETLKVDIANSLRERVSDKSRANQSIDHKQIIKVDLLVIEIYKGKITSDTVTIFTTNGGASCGVEFELGKAYIIYGQIKGHVHSLFLDESEDISNIEKENCYWTNRCTRTTVFNKHELEGLREMNN